MERFSGHEAGIEPALAGHKRVTPIVTKNLGAYLQSEKTHDMIGFSKTE
jgi:hypothetical protein